MDMRFSMEFPLVIASIVPGISISDFTFKNALPVKGVFEGISVFGTLSRPLFPGKLSVGAGLIGSEPGAFLQQAYEFTLWDRILVAADFRITWVSSLNGGEAVTWFDVGFSPGIILFNFK